MSIAAYDATTGTLTTLASGQRIWLGTKAAHDKAVSDGTMPSNVLVCLTDDYEDGSYVTHAENRTLGAKNILPPFGITGKESTNNGITYTQNADGSVSATGTATSGHGQCFFYFTPTFTGYVLLSGGVDATAHIYPWDYDRNARPYKDESKTDLQTMEQYGDRVCKFYVEEGVRYGATCRVNSGRTVDGIIFYPMIRVADDSDTTFVPYAKSNRDLTINRAVYSTSEQRVGTWLDNKPVYERTFQLTIPKDTSSNVTTDLSSFNISEVVSILQLVNWNSNISNNVYFPYQVSSSSGLSDTSPILYGRTYYSPSSGLFYYQPYKTPTTEQITFTVTMRYTKTTD